MIVSWLIEALYGLGRSFLYPLIYWAFLLLVYTSYRRVKRERKNFGTNVFGHFAEFRKTFVPALIFGIILTAISLLFGIFVTYEMIIVLSVVTILLSITGSTQLLSPGYTLSVTSIILFVLFIIPIDYLPNFFNLQSLTFEHFVSLAIILGFFLIVEIYFIVTTKEHHVFPSLTKGNRGVWIGQQQLKRLSIIPFITFMPIEETSMFTPFLPLFHMDGTSYQLIFIPFILGFQFNFTSELYENVIHKISNQKFILSVIVFLTIFASLYYLPLLIVAMVIAILGNEWIMYRFRRNDKYQAPLYALQNEGLKVVGIIPNSRAAQLGIFTGETIFKVNGIIVATPMEFYEALQQSGAFFKLDIIDTNGEVRFVRSALYAEDHHNLGLLFPDKPFTKRYEDLATHSETG